MASVAASDLLAREDYRVAKPVVSFSEARDLIDRFGGPLVVFSPEVLRRNFDTMTRCLPGVEFFYAINSNPDQIVLRAQALSCAGCHRLSTTAPDNGLGNGMIWPASLGFVHVSEQLMETDVPTRFRISDALKNAFLPARKANIEKYLAAFVE